MAIVYSDAMQGLHLTADLYQCRCDDMWVTNAARLGEWCVQAAKAAGLDAMQHLFHSTHASGKADGVSGALLMGKSHLCLHTWPGHRGVTLDVYVGGTSADQTIKARALMEALVERFDPEWTEQRSLDRGDGDA